MQSPVTTMSSATDHVTSVPSELHDFRSVRDEEGLPNQLYFVDRVPDDPFADVVESKMIN